MSTSLNGCLFMLIVLSIHFESFDDECAIVKEIQGTCPLRPEDKLK